MIFGSFFFIFFWAVSFFITCIASIVLIKIARKAFSVRARLHTPLTHHKKNPTIAIGGIPIMIGVLFGVLIFLPVTRDICIITVGLLLFGAIGFFDDCVKIYNGVGIAAKSKALLQVGAACIAVLLLYCSNDFFFTKAFFYVDSLYFYIFFIIWNFFIIVGTVNAINLTDGLDMLAIVVVIPICLFLLLVGLKEGNFSIALINTGLIGSLCGFVLFNAHPALLWMGDVGSLSIGAVIALSALILKVELFLPLVAAIPVFETLSVIMQIISFKFFGKKIFKMAPLHHHFELCGYSEIVIVKTAFIFSMTASLIGFILFLIIK